MSDGYRRKTILWFSFYLFYAFFYNLTIVQNKVILVTVYLKHTDSTSNTMDHTVINNNLGSVRNESTKAVYK